MDHPTWIIDTNLLNSLNALTTQSLILYNLALEVLDCQHKFQNENGVSLPVPQLNYIPDETIDDEKIPSQIVFFWPLKQGNIRLYVSEIRALISDPNGRLFAQHYDISDLPKAIRTVLEEILHRINAPIPLTKDYGYVIYDGKC